MMDGRPRVGGGNSTNRFCCEKTKDSIVPSREEKGQAMSEFDKPTQAHMDLVLEETCCELPHYGGDHESRKYIAEHLIDAARSGEMTLTDLRAVARRALLTLTSRKSA